MADAGNPRVIAGVPVYNGAEQLAQTLDSLLAQDYPNLEIIVADNASTDGTEQIGRAYAEQHANLTYVRQPKNLGAAGNFNYLLREADSEYFFWAGAHDLWAPRFASSLIAILERDPSLLSAYPAGRFLEQDGTPAERMGQTQSFLNKSAAVRYIRMVTCRSLYMLYGIFRLEALRRMPSWKHCIGPDLMQVNHLAVRGKIAGLDEELFYMRRGVDYGSAARYFANLDIPFTRREVFRQIWTYQRNHVRLAFMELPWLQAVGVSLVITPILLVKSLRLYAGLITEVFCPPLMALIRNKVRCR